MTRSISLEHGIDIDIYDASLTLLVIHVLLMLAVIIIGSSFIHFS